MAFHLRILVEVLLATMVLASLLLGLALPPTPASLAAEDSAGMPWKTKVKTEASGRLLQVKRTALAAMAVPRFHGLDGNTSNTTGGNTSSEVTTSGTISTAQSSSNPALFGLLSLLALPLLAALGVGIWCCMRKAPDSAVAAPETTPRQDFAYEMGPAYYACEVPPQAYFYSYEGVAPACAYEPTLTPVKTPDFTPYNTPYDTPTFTVNAAETVSATLPAKLPSRSSTPGLGPKAGTTQGFVTAYYV